MFITSDYKKAAGHVDGLIRMATADLAAALFCALFGAIYERFSHEVYSFYMIYAFAIPLALGAFPLLLTVVWSGRQLRGAAASDLAETGAGRPDVDAGTENVPAFYRLPGRFALDAWHAGLATLTVGCIFRGVLDIYGTTNRLLAVYPIAAAILLCAGLAACLVPAATADRMLRRHRTARPGAM